MRPNVAMQHVGATRLFLACWMLGRLLFGGQVFAEPARLTVQVDRPGPRVSPTLYGIFFEEINLAGDGGLYAELVRNRSFEDADQPDHWLLVSGGSMKGRMAIDAEQPMSAKNRRSLRLTIDAGGEGRVGVANSGYFGIALRKGAVYQLSLAARAGQGFAGSLTAALEDQGGRRVYAQAKIEGLGGRWKTFKTTLTANASDPEGAVGDCRLSAWRALARYGLPISQADVEGPAERPAAGPGRDAGRAAAVVRAVPRRLLGRGRQAPLGLALEDHDRRAFRASHAVQPVAVPVHQRLGLSRVSPDVRGPGGRAAVRDQLRHVAQGDRAPGQMAEWVQDALDAIEYANGPVQSRWGALRARAGHRRRST